MSSDDLVRIMPSLRKAVEQAAGSDGATLSQFVNVALAEKLSAMETERFYRERAVRGTREGFIRFLKNAGDEPPREGDRIEDEPSPQA